MFSIPQGTSVSGGDASGQTGDQSTGYSGFGDFNYNSQPPYLLIAVAVVVALWLIKK
tara:strand:- start:325 stop:495 length:171 start_codon:yes stop_codon:yes gene_type:complete